MADLDYISEINKAKVDELKKYWINELKENASKDISIQFYLHLYSTCCCGK